MSKAPLWIVIALLLAALVGGLAWLLGGTQAHPPRLQGLGADPAGVPAAAPGGSAAAGSGAGAGVGASGDRARADALLDPRASLPPLVAAEPLASGLRVLVLDVDGGRARHAEVAWLERPDTIDRPSWDRLLRTTKDPRRLFLRWGRMWLTDESGEAFVPVPLADAWLWARAGDAWTLATVGPQTRGLQTLELRPDRALEVEVLDADGDPSSGVPVVLRHLGPHSAVDVWEGTSEGIDGRVTVPGVAQLLDRERHREGRVVLTLGFPTARPVAIELAPGDLPTGIVTLPMPPTGSLAVVVRDAADGPPSHPFEVVISSAPLLDVEADRMPRFRPRLDVEAGRAELPLVGVGAALRVRAATLGGGVAVTRTVEGPARAGELVECRLRLDAGRPVLALRVVEPDGTPLGRRPLTLTARVLDRAGAALAVASQRVTSDPDGVVRHVLTLTAPGGARRELVVYPGHGPLGPGVPRATVDLSGAWEPGEFDLGDVVLEAAPLLVAGRVTDGAGAPVADASVRVERRIEIGAGRTVWADLAGFEARTDADGAFAVRGASEHAGELRALAALADRTSEPTPFERGDTDLELAVLRAARVAGSLLLDGGVPAERLLLRFVRAGTDEGVPLAGTAVPPLRPAADGRFVQAGLPPGAWRFRVELPGDPEPLLVVPFEVAEGFDGVHEALDGLDLRGRLASFTLTAVDEADQPIPRATVWLAPADAPAPVHHGVELVDGRVEVLVRGGPQAVEVWAPGRRPARLTGVAEDREVVLPRGLPVRVEVDGPVPETPSDVRLQVYLEPWHDADLGPAPLFVLHDDRGNRASSRLPWAAPEPVPLEKGEARLFAPEPGVWAVRWRLERKGTFDRMLATVPTDNPVVLEVEETDLEQIYRVPLTAAEVAAGIGQFPIRR